MVALRSASYHLVFSYSIWRDIIETRESVFCPLSRSFCMPVLSDFGYGGHSKCSCAVLQAKFTTERIMPRLMFPNYPRRGWRHGRAGNREVLNLPRKRIDIGHFSGGKVRRRGPMSQSMRHHQQKGFRVGDPTQCYGV